MTFLLLEHGLCPGLGSTCTQLVTCTGSWDRRRWPSGQPDSRSQVRGPSCSSLGNSSEGARWECSAGHLSLPGLPDHLLCSLQRPSPTRTGCRCGSGCGPWSLPCLHQRTSLLAARDAEARLERTQGYHFLTCFIFIHLSAHLPNHPPTHPPSIHPSSIHPPILPLPSSLHPSIHPAFIYP